jgi:hypothetical protein
MNRISPWHFLRDKDPKRGLALILEAYPQEPTPSYVMQLGIAYLWVRDYAAAGEHFQAAIRTDRHPPNSFYGMGGVAKWCIGDSVEAVKLWRAGDLDAHFADAGGLGITLPLLLFVASILQPEVFSRADACNILNAKIKDPRVKNWPGPLARFVLDPDDEYTLPGVHDRDTQHRKWLKHFYEAILEFNRKNSSLRGFRERMMALADTSQPEWSEEKSFLSLLWSEEFFIARHESSLMSPFR